MFCTVCKAVFSVPIGEHLAKFFVVTNISEGSITFLKSYFVFLYQSSFAGSSIVSYSIELKRESSVVRKTCHNHWDPREKKLYPTVTKEEEKKKIEGYNKNKKIKPSNVLVRAVPISLLEDKCGF